MDLKRYSEGLTIKTHLKLIIKLLKSLRKGIENYDKEEAET